MRLAGIEYPFTHDLGELLSLALSQFPSLAEFADSVPFYTDFAVAARYDESVSPSREEVLEALEVTGPLRQKVLAELR